MIDFVLFSKLCGKDLNKKISKNKKQNYSTRLFSMNSDLDILKLDNDILKCILFLLIF